MARISCALINAVHLARSGDGVADNLNDGVKAKAQRVRLLFGSPENKETEYIVYKLEKIICKDIQRLAGMPRKNWRETKQPSDLAAA